jgi:hypothetical protein
MTKERMLEYLVINDILKYRPNRVEMTEEEYFPLFDRMVSLEDEFVNEYKLPASINDLVKD